MVTLARGEDKYSEARIISAQRVRFPARCPLLPYWPSRAGPAGWRIRRYPELPTSTPEQLDGVMPAGAAPVQDGRDLDQGLEKSSDQLIHDCVACLVEFVLQDRVYLTRVGFAAGLFHDLTHKKSDQFFFA